MEFRQEKRLVIFKKVLIQIVALISALVLLAVPAAATEYGLEWRMYLGDGYNNVNPGGIYFYTYNRTEGEYICLTTKNQFDGKWFRGTWVDNKYTSASVIFNQPVDPNEFQRVFGGSAIEKFYIEFPAAFHFGSTSKDYLGPTNLYLGTLDFVVMEDGTEVKYTVELDKDSFKNNNSLQSLHTTIGFTVTPSVPLSDISYVAFNFDFIPQYDRFYIQARPNGPIVIKTGDNIPVDAPSAEKVAGDIMDSIPVDNDGLVNALENFGGAMMHNTTKCSWKVPSIMFPKIEGVSDGTAQLVPEMDIDFEEYAGLIPEGIMTLIQALTTVYLIGYCIYELYGMIEYVMTMRKGGGSE